MFLWTVHVEASDEITLIIDLNFDVYPIDLINIGIFKHEPLIIIFELFVFIFFF